MSRESNQRALVVTLGPASFGLAPQLAQAGATAFRLNASHMGVDALRDAVDGLRRVCADAPLVVDLQGAKMRLGECAERSLAPGDRITLSFDAGPGVLPVPHAALFAQVRPGETLSIDDDRLRFEVEQVEGLSLVARARTGGVLRSRKGLNVVEHPVVLRDLAPRDAAVVAALANATRVTWALSFMADGSEAAWVRERAPDAAVIGKIERREATQNLAAIASATDAIWICRGDLGAQIGIPALARFVAGLDPRALGRAVLMAGQVLEHLTAHSEPTRSEACHLHDLLARGYAGIVLSDETAIGEDPVAATRTAALLLRQLG
jgi:pyruvate kinase